MTDECADFIETYTGRAVRPWGELKPTDVCIVDIAHALSQECRWGGQIDPFYSVGQHSCLIADFVNSRGAPPIDCLRALMHDASEAYLKDVPRPLKNRLPLYREWEASSLAVIYTWLGIGGVEPMPPWLREIDTRMLADEREQLMSCKNDLDYGFVNSAIGIPIDPWLPRTAEQHFLIRYSQYTQKLYGQHQYLRSAWGIPTKSTFMEFPFRTVGGDTRQQGDAESIVIADLLEVDLRGNVGRVALRSENGMMIRDTKAGQFPRPAWQFIHGQFELVPGAA